jgi:hypothetical protein
MIGSFSGINHIPEAEISHKSKYSKSCGNNVKRMKGYVAKRWAI